MTVADNFGNMGKKIILISGGDKVDGIDRLLKAIHEFKVANNYSEHQVAEALKNIAYFFEDYAELQAELSIKDKQSITEILREEGVEVE